jgi:hypothetical protein
MHGRPDRLLVAAFLALAALAEPASAQLAVASTTLIFPHFEIAKKSRTELRITNASGLATANVQLEFLCAAPSPGGVCAGSSVAPFMLGPHATRVVDVDAEAPPCTEGAARATSDQPLIGSYSFGKGSKRESGAAIDAGLAATELFTDFRSATRKEGTRLDLVDPAAAMGANPERTVGLDVWDEPGGSGFATAYSFTCVGSVRLGDLLPNFSEKQLGTGVGSLRLTSPSGLVGAVSEYRGKRGVSRPLFVSP